MTCCRACFAARGGPRAGGAAAFALLQFACDFIRAAPVFVHCGAAHAVSRTAIQTFLMASSWHDARRAPLGARFAALHFDVFVRAYLLA